VERILDGAVEYALHDVAHDATANVCRP